MLTPSLRATRRLIVATGFLASVTGFGCTGEIREAAQRAGAPPPVRREPTPSSEVAGVLGPASTPGGGGVDNGRAANPEPPMATPPAGTVVEPPPQLTSFSCPSGGVAAPGPRRLWRLTGTQYVNTISAFMSGRLAAGKTLARPSWLTAALQPPGSGELFSNYASAGSMTDFELRRMMLTAGDGASALVAQQRQDPKTCLGARTKPFAACIRDLISERGPLLFGRPLTADEIETYANVAVKGAAQFGEEEAAALALQRLLVAPQFVFRSEMGVAAADLPAGTTRLGPFELATSIAYTLTDAPPDQPLWAAATSGQLDTTEGLRAHVLRLIGTFSRDSSTTLRFLREYFPYSRLLDVFKDKADTGFVYDPAALLQDAEAFVASVVTQSGHKELLKTILTTEEGYYQNGSAGHYNLKPPSYAPTRFMFPSGQRAGILTQPAFLVAFSEMTHNQPVQRGRYISETLLCRPVPDLPIGVIPEIPEDPKRQLREKLAEHAKGSCAVCHRLMDPLGLAFERYDHAGRPRDTEAGRPVDASGALTEAGNQNGPFENAVQLVRRLADSAVVEQCFVRHSFRYWFGRNEQDGDTCTLVEAQAAYRRGSGDYRELIASLLTSRGFVYRKAQ